MTNSARIACGAGAPNVPFDFSRLPLLPATKQQLTNAACEVLSGNRNEFSSFLFKQAFNPKRGTYLPISPYLELAGKLPTYSEKVPTGHLYPTHPVFYTNSLLIPSGYGSNGFNPIGATSPSLRLTNGGVLFVTIAIDNETAHELEANLAWTRGGPKSKIADLHRILARHKDFRGVAVNWSGRRSVHFTFVYSTKQLQKAPFDCASFARNINIADEAPLMANVYGTIYDHVLQNFMEVLQPIRLPDDRLTSPVRWRRFPNANRELEKDCPILELTRGTRVPQLMLYENLLTRSSNGSTGYLISPDHSLAIPV